MTGSAVPADGGVPREGAQDRPDRSGRWLGPVVVAGLAVMAVSAVFRMQTSVADFDPQYMRVLVERKVALGGSYYENGIHNKGPLEPVVYEFAHRVGGPSGFWFVIAVASLVAASVIGLAAAVTARRFGAGPMVAWSVAVATAAHLTLSSSDYAGVLYARNLTVAMLAAAFVVGALDRCWTNARDRLVATVVTGAVIGLAVQTMLTTAFTATPVLVWVLWRRRRLGTRFGPVPLVLPAISALVFVSAPVIALLTGRWRAFIDGWWVYARFMSVATERSLGGQIGLGLDQFAEHYRDRPWVFIAIQAFVVVSAFRWRVATRIERSLRLLLFAWWLGAWIELVLSQRYSTHYFVVLAVPTILMIASVVGDLSRLTGLRRIDHRLVVVPLLAAVLVLVADGTGPLVDGARSASSFRGISDFRDERDRGLDPGTKMVRASLDLVSAPGDPLLVWTNRPWPYLNLQRISATRYIWRSFLLGQIYLAGSGEQYVLPGTWDRFTSDLERTQPTAFVVEQVDPVVRGTVFDDVVRSRFDTVYHDEVVTVAYRSDLADWLKAPPVSPVPATTNSTAEENGVVIDAAHCMRIDGTLRLHSAGIADDGRGGGGGGGPVTFLFSPQSTGSGSESALIIVAPDGDGSYGVTSVQSDGAAFATPATLEDADIAFTLVGGARAAVLVVDGEIVAAVALDGPSTVTVTSPRAEPALADLVRSGPIAGSGC